MELLESIEETPHDKLDLSFFKSKKKPKIFLIACFTGIVTHQEHHTTSFPEGSGFFNTSFLYPKKN
jgi:hypothetical protein